MNALFDPPVRTIADLLQRLADIPADRVRFTPMPGTAKLEDLLLPENEHCELVDNTLVEKPVGLRESIFAGLIIQLLNEFVIPRNLGYVAGEAGFVELTGGSVRSPDVAFFSWERLPKRRLPVEPIPTLSPDLAVEVLSKSNTKKEMARKYKEYFRSSVRLVWEFDPRKRTVRVLAPGVKPQKLTADDTLGGDPVLLGFTLPLNQLFAQMDRRG